MKTIIWKLNLRSPVETVFNLLSTSDGRSRFWAESAKADGHSIHFIFPNGQTYIGRIIKVVRHREFQLEYFDSLVKFQLQSTEHGGTDLTLINENVPEAEFEEVKAGWVSVLMHLKAMADFGCDLRNHHPDKTWDQGYLDN